MGHKTCPKCGAALDPGEHCDCTDEKDNAPPKQGTVDKFVSRRD